jgi:hypothetical protein
LVRNWIIAEHASAELELKAAAQGGTGDAVIHIKGGLPPVPGCENLIMPVLNGHAVEGVPAPAPATPTECPPAQQETSNPDPEKPD